VKPGESKGQWTLLSSCQPPKFSKRHYADWGKFRCSCGNERVVAMYEVLSGRSRSCVKCARDRLRGRARMECRLAEEKK